MNLTTPSSVQKLQAALHDKAKGSPKFRFYALYDKVHRQDVLFFTYECCKANGGAAGVDGQTFEDIEEYGVTKWLDELTQELKSRTYRPQPVRRVWIPKPDGKQRPLGVPAIKDREAAVLGNTAPFARIDWNTAEKQLEQLAQASGGRAYSLQSEVEVLAIYDDIVENLRIRYVITYVSSNPSQGGSPRNIRVELVDPKTGQPLKIRDAAGKVVSARVFVQQTYTPKVSTSELRRLETSWNYLAFCGSVSLAFLF